VAVRESQVDVADIVDALHVSLAPARKSRGFADVADTKNRLHIRNESIALGGLDGQRPRGSRFSSNREEIRGLGPAPAEPMRATALDRLLASAR
jgi:hypothetical protein